MGEFAEAGSDEKSQRHEQLHCHVTTGAVWVKSFDLTNGATVGRPQEQNGLTRSIGIGDGGQAANASNVGIDSIAKVQNHGFWVGKSGFPERSEGKGDIGVSRVQPVNSLIDYAADRKE